MKRYEGAKILSREEFRREKGVYPETFVKMVEILRVAHKQKKSRGGRPNKLKYRRYAFNGLRVLAGVPHLFSYRLRLWSFRVKYIPNNKMDRERLD